MKKDKKILFLDVKDEKDFYNIQRNLHKEVNSVFIFSSNSRFQKIIRRICLKFNLNLIKYTFGNWKKELNKYETIIITDSIYNNLISKNIRKNFDGRIIMWYWNPVVAAFNPSYIETTDCELWSFDKNDCEKYNMKYNQTYYFNTIKLPKEKIDNDVYFVGADKGRLNKLIEIENLFKEHGLKTHFHITKSKKTVENNYQFKKNIDYNEVLRGISRSKVILDYVQDGQSGLTQRPMESIFYSKKLITNDKKIIEYDFYNEKNIFILGYDDIENIYEFVNSEYSPVDETIIKKYDFANWCKRIEEGK